MSQDWGSILVPAIGPMGAKVMLIGEAPGESEEKQQVPFVGQAGRLLDGMMDEVGINRDSCYITNVVQYRPKNNDFAKFYQVVKGKKQPSDLLVESCARLKDEIAACQPNVIVCVGNEALKAVTGLSGIAKYRGSVLNTALGKVVPIYHPAAVLRMWKFRVITVADLGKVKKESESAAYKETFRELVIPTNLWAVKAELDDIKKAKRLAFDIETKHNKMSWISFSDRLYRSVAVPFLFPDGREVWEEEHKEIVMEMVRDILMDQGIEKIAQNGLFDTEFLDRVHGVKVAGFKWDTALMFHCMYAELPKGLDFLTSFYTDQPYYKDMINAKEFMEQGKYNALDSCVTFEVESKLEGELREQGLMDFYIEKAHPLIAVLSAMQTRGVRFDREKRNMLRREYKKRIEERQQALNALLGYEINVGSPKQMAGWLYKEAGLKEKTKLRKDRGTKTVTTDEDALIKCRAETKDPKVAEAINLVLAIRHDQKILGTYLEFKLDSDDRVRCSYNVTGTETGRLSSSQTVEGTGGNLQNIPEGDVKSLFLPDAGMVMVNVDLSQAEARIVAHVADEPRLIEIFEGGGDIHKINAGNIYRVAPEDVTEEQRSIGKMVSHASNYMIGPKTLAQNVGIPMVQAKELLGAYFAAYPRIRIWHMRVREQLSRLRYLQNPLGRRRLFFGRMGDSLVREGLAFIPQSTVADMVNMAMIKMHACGIMLLMQVHDSIVFQVSPDKLDWAVGIAKKCLEFPIQVGNKSMVIPMDVKVGENWEDMRKYEAQWVWNPERKIKAGY